MEIQPFIAVRHFANRHTQLTNRCQVNLFAIRDESQQQLIVHRINLFGQLTHRHLVGIRVIIQLCA